MEHTGEVLTRCFRWPWLLPLIGVLCAGIAAAWWRLPAGEGRRWGYLLFAAAALLAVLCLLMADRRAPHPHEQLRPLLLAAGVLLLAAGVWLGPALPVFGALRVAPLWYAALFLLGHAAWCAGLLVGAGRYPRGVLALLSMAGDVILTAVAFTLLLVARVPGLSLLPPAVPALPVWLYHGGLLVTLLTLVVVMSAAVPPCQRGPRRLLLLGSGLALGGDALLGALAQPPAVGGFPVALCCWSLGYPLLGVAALWEHAARPRDAGEVRAIDDYLSAAGLLLPGVLLTAAALLLLLSGRQVLHAPNALLVYRLLVLVLLLVTARFVLNVLRSRAAYAQLLQRVRESERLSVTDALTGLPNKRACLQRLEDELARARRYTRPFAVLFCDIDFFKLINDVHGHAVGDMALVAVGRCLRGRIRTTDLVARMGGEEFVLVLPETTAAQAGILAERLRQAVADLQVFTPGNQMLHMTISIGIAGYPETSESVEDVLAHADTAMHHAKESGRNRVATAKAKVHLFSVVEN